MTTQALQYSYSGADCDVFAIRAGKAIQLKSVATVSVSVYDAKAPVRALGHKNVLGYTGSIRTVAGSIVFVVVEEHPLNDLMRLNHSRYHLDNVDKQVSYVPKHKVGGTYPIGSISPFTLMLLYHNEIGNGAGLEIDNIEFVSEGIVTSVNDMVTEVVVQFVATGFRQLKGTGPNKVITKTKKNSSAKTKKSSSAQVASSANQGSVQAQEEVEVLAKSTTSKMPSKTMKLDYTGDVRSLIEDTIFEKHKDLVAYGGNQLWSDYVAKNKDKIMGIINKGLGQTLKSKVFIPKKLIVDLIDDVITHNKEAYRAELARRRENAAVRAQLKYNSLRDTLISALHSDILTSLNKSLGGYSNTTIKDKW